MIDKALTLSLTLWLAGTKDLIKSSNISAGKRPVLLQMAAIKPALPCYKCWTEVTLLMIDKAMTLALTILDPVAGQHQGYLIKSKMYQPEKDQYCLRWLQSSLHCLAVV